MKAYHAAYGGWGRMASAAFDGNYATPLLRAMSDAGLAAWHAIDGDYQCVGGVANAVACFAAPENSEDWIAARQNESAAQADLIREIIGNPFRSTPFDSTWRTTETVLLARSSYESRDYSSMPQLGAALASAGCTNPAILDHCQQTAPHIRGCWVVDLILDMKE